MEPELNDLVRFCQGNPARTMLTGVVIRAPWGTKALNVTIRTTDQPPRTFVRLVADVQIIRKAA